MDKEVGIFFYKINKYLVEAILVYLRPPFKVIVWDRFVN